METNITRRRLMQGAGAIGIAGVAGNAVISASGNDTAAAFQEDESTALRVAHASPDTPTVEVHVNEAGAVADDGGAGDGGDGDDAQDDATATPTDDGAGDDGDAQEDEEPLIDGVGFREVSEYNEVDPGTYQVRIVATESSGLLESIFGGDQEERVVFDEELEIEEGTTYTAVAYGELAQTEGLGEQADEPATTPDGATTPTDDEDDTTGDDGTTPTGTPEDETTPAGTPEDETTPAGTPEDDTPTDDAETTPEAGDGEDGQVVIESLGFGEADTFELDAADYTLEFREALQVEEDIEGAEQEPSEDGPTTPETTPTDDEDDTTGDDTTGDDQTTPATTPTDDEDDTTGDDTTGDDTTGDDQTTPETTPTDDEGDTTGDDMEQDMGFQVALLEDDLSAPGEGDAAGDGTPADTPTETDGTGGNDTTGDNATGDDATPTTTDDDDDGGILGGDDQDGPFRLRIFHAVPDVDAMDVVATESEDGGLLGGGDDEGNETEGTATPGNDTVGTATPDDEEPAGTPTETPEGTPGGPDAEAQEDQVQEADISPKANTVYSGFAVGYFDPQAAAGEETPAGNETGGVGNETGDGNMTGNGNETGDGTPTETPDEITEDAEGEEFELVTVQDWSDGERADGGTGGGGILPAAKPPEAASD